MATESQSVGATNPNPNHGRRSTKDVATEDCLKPWSKDRVDQRWTVDSNVHFENCVLNLHQRRESSTQRSTRNLLAAKQSIDQAAQDRSYDRRSWHWRCKLWELLPSHTTCERRRVYLIAIQFRSRMCIHSIPMLISSKPGSCQRGQRFKRQLDTAVVEDMRIEV